MSLPLLGLEVFVDSSGVDAGLAGVEGAGERISAGLEDKLAGASDGMKDLGKSSAGASRGIQGLAAVVSLVDPRLGQVIRSVGTLTRGLSVLRLGFGVALPAVAAVTAALYLYQQRQQAVAEQERRDKAISDAMRESRLRLKDATTALNVELGYLSETERKLLQIRRQAFVESMPAVKEFTRQITEQSRATQLARDEFKEQTDAMEGVIIRYEQGTVLAENLAMLTDIHSGKVRDAALAYQEEKGKLDELQSTYIEFLDNLGETIDKREKEVIQSERNRDAVVSERDALVSLNRGKQKLLSLTQQLADIESSARQAVMSEEQLIIAQMDERLAKLQEITQATQGYIDVTKAETTVRMQAAHELRELEAARHEARMEELKTEREEERAAMLERLNAASSLTSALAGLAAEHLGNSKSAKIAEARLNQLLALTTAIASNPTPIGVAQGLASVATIEAQIASMGGITAHRGRLHGDEFMVRARRGEAHLSNVGRQIMGDRAIEDANAGRRPRGGMTVVAIHEYRGRPFGKFIDDHLKQSGPLRSAIQGAASTTTGRREY